jgi:uncharacterized SAM-binding protein YcdF (DUF218 family)
MPHADTPAADSNASRRHAGVLVRMLRLVSRIAIISVLVVVAGFFWFLHVITPNEEPLDGKADGIVVLTGGASRVDDAIELLAQGKGQRLLISGVNRQTPDREIVRLRPEYEDIVNCCVDMDRTAVNTITNATETRRWVEERGFRSLIVVTSNYHIPRAMAELSHQLPNITLVAFPVVSEQMRAGWTNAANLRLLLTEYVKYVVAVARIHVPALDRYLA